MTIKDKRTFAALIAIGLAIGGCEAVTPATGIAPVVETELKKEAEAAGPGAERTPERRQACEDAGLAAKAGDQTQGLQLSRILKLAANLKSANRILDCIIGPVALSEPPGLAQTEERFHKLQFRGHMVVTLLTRFAMFNYIGSIGPEGRLPQTEYDSGPDDAALTLVHIETAERYLRQHISAVNPKALKILTTPTGHIPFEESERLHRVISVMQVVVDSHRPSIARTKRFALNLVGAIAGGPGAITDTLNQVANGLGSAVVVRAFTDAYMRDAINYWDDLKSRKVTAQDWYFWDVKLKEACDALSEYSGVSGHHCLAGSPAPKPGA